MPVVKCDVMLSKECVQDQARQIVASLAGLDARAALQILASTLDLILSQPDQDGSSLRTPVKDTSPRILRRRGGVSKVAQDSELQRFIDALDQPTTLRELRQTLIKRFGTSRVPSKSALHRYLQRRAEGE